MFYVTFFFFEWSTLFFDPKTGPQSIKFHKSNQIAIRGFFFVLTSFWKQIAIFGSPFLNCMTDTETITINRSIMLFPMVNVKMHPILFVCKRMPKLNNMVIMNFQLKTYSDTICLRIDLQLYFLFLLLKIISTRTKNPT
jgi:hypothetical protein